MSKTGWLITGILVIALIVWGVFIVKDRNEVEKMPQQVNELPANWLLQDSDGAIFGYPPSLNTKYISIVDWPPEAQVINETYQCIQAGTNTSPAGETREVTIQGTKYCITTVTGGAAGSVYIQYAYARGINDKTVILTFSLRFPQCGNYSTEEKTMCEAERSSFNINETIHMIFSTLKLK